MEREGCFGCVAWMVLFALLVWLAARLLIANIVVRADEPHRVAIPLVVNQAPDAWCMAIGCTR